MSIITFSNPPEVLAAIPHLIGFYPNEAIVIAANVPGGRVLSQHYSLTAPIDAPLAVADLVTCGATRAVVVSYTDIPRQADATVTEVANLLDTADIRLIDVIAVSGGQWHSTSGADPGTGADHGRVPERDSAIASHFIARGMPALASRQAVTDLLAPAEAPAVKPVNDAITALVEELANPSSQTRKTRFDEAVSHLLDFESTAIYPSPKATAVLAVAGWHPDFAGIAFTTAKSAPDEHLDLWRWVVRHVSGQHRAPAAVFCAYAAWQSGQTILAADAARIATASKPGWPAAQAVLDMVSTDPPPNTFA